MKLSSELIERVWIRYWNHSGYELTFASLDWFDHNGKCATFLVKLKLSPIISELGR